MKNKKYISHAIEGVELTKALMLCDKDPEYFSGLTQEEQNELKHYCREIVKYSGTTHNLVGGKVFTDKTLLKPAKILVKSLKKRKVNKCDQQE